MSVATWFLNWWSERLVEESEYVGSIPDTERLRYNRLKEHLGGPLPDDLRTDIVKEIRYMEWRYGLPRSVLPGD